MRNRRAFSLHCHEYSTVSELRKAHWGCKEVERGSEWLASHSLRQLWRGTLLSACSFVHSSTCTSLLAER